jgi:hypothetical protein
MNLPSRCGRMPDVAVRFNDIDDLKQQSAQTRSRRHRVQYPRPDKAETDRLVRQGETAYKKRGYSDAGAEAEAEKDFQLAEILRKRRRFPKDLGNLGTPN